MMLPDPRETRAAFAKFATGVCIVTASDAGKPIGMTISSFNTVSLEPPMVLWSVGQRAPEFQAFCAAKHYAIHVLSDQQVSLSNRFATPGIDKFEGIEEKLSSRGVPLIGNVLACFHCSAKHNFAAGDHNILVAEVTELDQPGRHQLPLVYFDSDYHLMGNSLKS